MDDITKQTLMAEVSVVKAIVTAAGGPTGALSQTTFNIAGPMVVIPSLAIAGGAFKQQGEAINKLASLVEKLIKAS